ncbi:MAG: hypothetical protein ACI363_00515 [Phocaeicola plebeius]
MKKLGTWMLLMAAACASAQAQYFCTTNGTELQYVNYDESGQSTSTETMTVANAVDKGGFQGTAEYYVKIVNTKVKNNTSYTKFNWIYDGTNTVCVEDLMYGPYIASDSDPARYTTDIKNALMEDYKFKGDNSFTLSEKARGGQTFPDRAYTYISNMLKKEVTVSGGSYMEPEEVSTTAGKFACIKISYLQQTKVVLKKETLRITEWYAEGIGLVKREAYTTKGKLHSKTLLTKVNEK